MCVHSKVNLREGYHQVILHKNIRGITSFATHKGVYCYKRLIYEVNSAFELFQTIIEQIIRGYEGARNIIDNVVIWATNQRHRDSRLGKVLHVIKKMGFKINPKEGVLSVNTLTVGGHTISINGILADPKTTDTIQKSKIPSLVSEIKQFLGMTNYCHQYIGDQSTIYASLRLLTKKNQPLVLK